MNTLNISNICNLTGSQLKDIVSKISFSDEQLMHAASLVGYSGNARQLFDKIKNTNFGNSSVSNLLGSTRNNTMRSNKTQLKNRSVNSNQTRRNKQPNLMLGGYPERRLAERREHRYRNQPLSADEKIVLFFAIILVLGAKALGMI